MTAPLALFSVTNDYSKFGESSCALHTPSVCVDWHVLRLLTAVLLPEAHLGCEECRTPFVPPPATNSRISPLTSWNIWDCLLQSMDALLPLPFLFNPAPSVYSHLFLSLLFFLLFFLPPPLQSSSLFPFSTSPSPSSSPSSSSSSPSSSSSSSFLLLSLLDLLLRSLY